MLNHAAAGDPSRWFQVAASISNRWRVCGLAATYTMLHAIGPAQGRLVLVAQTPGLRATRVRRVTEALGGETDLVLVTAMDFDDRAALDAGLASDPMRQAGRNLREIAPGVGTFLVLEDAPDLG